MKLDEIVNALVSVKGVIAAAVADYESGMMLAFKNSDSSFDLEVAVACSVNIMRAKARIMQMTSNNDVIHDIQLNFRQQYQLICPCTKRDGLFVYLVADREVANLSIIRRALFHAEGLV